MHSTEVTLKVQQAVAAIRANWYPRTQPPLSERQALSRRDFPFKGPLWICRTEFAISDDDELRGIFLEAIGRIGNKGARTKYQLYGGESVKVEWNGYRQDSDAGKLPHKGASEREKYNLLMNDTTSDVTILYVHGGGYR